MSWSCCCKRQMPATWRRRGRRTGVGELPEAGGLHLRKGLRVRAGEHLAAVLQAQDKGDLLATAACDQPCQQTHRAENDGAGRSPSNGATEALNTLFGGDLQGLKLIRGNLLPLWHAEESRPLPGLCQKPSSVEAAFLAGVEVAGVDRDSAHLSLRCRGRGGKSTINRGSAP